LIYHRQGRKEDWEGDRKRKGEGLAALSWRFGKSDSEGKGSYKFLGFPVLLLSESCLSLSATGRRKGSLWKVSLSLAELPV
jgi:hypothetical protein